VFRVAGTVLCLLMLVGGVALAATSPAPKVVDSRTRGFASIAGVCVHRVDEVWKTAPASIRAAPDRYYLHVEDAVARCTVDYRGLVRLDRSGAWKPFEASARLGIGAVQSWARGANELLLALKSPSGTLGKRHLAAAEADTTHAVLLWRRCVAGMNAARRRAGLPPFSTSP
jgi:hypothetical protein